MAKDSSFDVVSEVNMQEVDNAFQQTTREISQRYDLKDSGATIELSKGDKLFTVNAPADFVSKQIVDVLSSKLIKRGIDLKDRVEFKVNDPEGPRASWARYIYGICQEMKALGVDVKGFNAAFYGDVPLGAGMSSSAALESCFAFPFWV